jgi:hypothetical protein
MNAYRVTWSGKSWDPRPVTVPCPIQWWAKELPVTKGHYVNQGVIYANSLAEAKDQLRAYWPEYLLEEVAETSPTNPWPTPQLPMPIGARVKGPGLVDLARDEVKELKGEVAQLNTLLDALKRDAELAKNTDAMRERMALLAEECGELIQVIGGPAARYR